MDKKFHVEHKVDSTKKYINFKKNKQPYIHQKKEKTLKMHIDVKFYTFYKKSKELGIKILTKQKNI